MPVRSKAQAAGLAEFGELVWREDADEAAVQGIVFSNRRHGVRHAEWTLAGNYNVAVGRDRKIERAEFRIRHQPGRLDRSRGSERDNGVVALDWYRQRLLGDGWKIYNQRIPGKLQTLYWKDKWLLTIGHNVSFPMDHPPHARFELLLIWDYWHQLEQTSQDNVEKASK